MAELDVLPAGTLVGECTLDAVVSVGGFGLVYEARRSTDRRRVAVKIGKSRAETLTAQQLVWQQNEVEALTRLKHPSLVEILGYGYLEDGRLYLVMEFVDGPTLSEYVAHKGRLDALEATRITQRIAEALAHCHASKILHLDLKPANIIVTDPYESKVKVLDFGLARLTTGLKVGDAGAVAGTIAYMAPESFSAGVEGLGPKSDLYALGALFYEMLSGGLPYPVNASGPEIVALKKSGHLPPLEEVVPGLPPAVRTLIHLLLSPQPARRFGSAAALAERLNALYFETLHGKGETSEGADSQSLENEDAEVPLVGRNQELAAIRRAIEAARSGQGRALVVIGDPGIGKSRLVGEALAEASRESPLCIGSGRCRSLGELLPYSPLREVLGQLVPALEVVEGERGERARTKAGEVLVGSGRELLKLVPELSELLPEGTAAASGLVRGIGADLVSHSLVELLTAVASEIPVCAVIEDIHWADEGTLAVLSRIIGGGPLPSVLFVCTSRSSPKLPQSPHLEEMALGPLSPDENLDLLATLTGGADAVALGTLLESVPLLATGNPFVNAQIARQLQSEGFLTRKPGSGFAVSDRIRQGYRAPDSVYDAVERGLERLEPGVRRVLQIASLFDRQFSISDLVALGIFSEAEVAHAVETARRNRLCSVEADQCTFAHDTIREKLASSAGGDDLPEIHRRIAQRLGERKVSLGTLAYHHQCARDYAQAASAYVEAGLEADRLHDPIGATHLLKQAFALFSQLPAGPATDDLVTRAVYELVRISCLSGNAGDTLQYLEKGAALISEETPARELALQSASARVYYGQGNFPKAVEFSQRCMALAKSAPELRQYQFIPANTIGRALCGTGKFGPSIPVLTQACAVAAEAGEQIEQTHTEGILCVALAYTGEYEKARQHAETCRRFSLELEDPVRIAASFFYFATLAEAQFRWDEGVAQTAELLAFAEKNGISGLYRIVGTIYAARHQFHIGQLDRAKLLLTQVLNLAKQLGIQYGVTWAHAFLGDLEFVANRWEAAHAAYSQGLALSNAGAKDEYAAPLCLIGLAHLAACQGGARDEVARIADEAVARLRATSNHTTLAVACQRYAEALEAIGDAAGAEKWRSEWKQIAARLRVTECDFWPRVTRAGTSLSRRDFWRSRASTSPEPMTGHGDDETVIPNLSKDS
jgi:eukaryotic-like serine/threonine-protein kinase